MQGKHWITLLWIASLAAAWLIGQQTGPTSQEAADTALLEENADLRDRIAQLEGAREEQGPALEARGADPGAGTAKPADAGGATPASKGGNAKKTAEEAVEKIDLASLNSPNELSQAFLAYARTMLAKGREGHLELLAFIGSLGGKENEDHFERIFAAAGERAIPGALYPVIKFAVTNEQQVMALTETFFEQAAEKPEWFEGMDDDPFELFTEGIGMLAPAIMDKKQLTRMRGYAKAYLEQDEKTQPKALARNRRDVERLLRLWAPPMPVEELLAKLEAGTLSEAEIMSLLPTLPAEAMKHIDIDRYLGPRVEKGDWQAVNMLRRVPNIDAVTLSRLDQRVYRGAGAEKSRIHPWFLRNYMRNTGRRTWAKMRSFFETGLGIEGKTADTFAQGLMQLGNDGPDKDWVSWAVGHFNLSDGVAGQLKRRFGIKD